MRVLSTASLLCGGALLAQAPPASPPSIEDDLLAILNTPVVASSTKAMSQRESPGVLAVLTRENIRATGARDLLELLRTVPGIDFAADLDGVVGISARGLWAHEGKALILWDGVPLNELLYGNTPFGQRFPVDQIARLEVVRGPGSALYGGLAELMVVRITSIENRDIGGLVHGSWGPTRRDAGIAWSQDQGAMRLSVGAYASAGFRTTERYFTDTGQERDGKASTGIDSQMFRLGVRRGAFSVQTLLNDYRVEDPMSAPPAWKRREFSSQAADIRYAWKPGGTWKVTPYLTYQRARSWHTITPTEQKPRVVQRLEGGLQVTADLNSLWNIGFGANGTRDFASKGALASEALALSTDGRRQVSYSGSSAYGELGYRGPVNLLLGGRWERHSAAGTAFVPRVALTKAWERLYAKLLWCQAFRTPNILNLGNRIPGADIQAEKVTSTEAQVGYVLGRHMMSVNLFHTQLDKPLVYVPAGVQNGPKTATRGFELEYALRGSAGSLTASYASHRILDPVFDWSVPGHDGYAMGLAREKARPGKSGWNSMTPWIGKCPSRWLTRAAAPPSPPQAGRSGSGSDTPSEPPRTAPPAAPPPGCAARSSPGAPAPAPRPRGPAPRSRPGTP